MPTTDAHLFLSGLQQESLSKLVLRAYLKRKDINLLFNGKEIPGLGKSHKVKKKKKLLSTKMPSLKFVKEISL